MPQQALGRQGSWSQECFYLIKTAKDSNYSLQTHWVSSASFHFNSNKLLLNCLSSYKIADKCIENQSRHMATPIVHGQMDDALVLMSELSSTFNYNNVAIATSTLGCKYYFGVTLYGFLGGKLLFDLFLFHEKNSITSLRIILRSKH